MNCGSLSGITAEICRSGQKQDGGGVEVRLLGADGSLLIKLEIPLTLNRNGAWQLSTHPGRYCRKDKLYIPYGGLRPTKAKEMATSTNTWLDIMPTLKAVLEGHNATSRLEGL